MAASIHFTPAAPDPQVVVRIPVPTPAPRPKAIPQVNWTATAVVLMLILQLWNHWPVVSAGPSPLPGPSPPPIPAPDTPAGKAGAAYRLELLASAKAGFDAAAAKLRAGSTMADAAAESRSVSEAARKAAFVKLADPVITVIVKPGSEPATPAEREALAKAFEDLGRGMAGGP